MQVVSDKSLSHRALIFSALTKGKSRIRNLSPSLDVSATRKGLEVLGLRFEEVSESDWEAESSGVLRTLGAAAHIDCENSGTTMRLLAGLLCSQKFNSVLDGDKSLRNRPMGRVARPLAQLGAAVELSGGNFAPLKIGCVPRLTGASIGLPLPSAQVRSAVILAALRAKGVTRICGNLAGREHTERMLKALGAPVSISPDEIVVSELTEPLESFSCQIPGDPSALAFWLTAAILWRQRGRGKNWEFHDVLLSESRIGFLKIARRMGANIYWETERFFLGEPVGSVSLNTDCVNLGGTNVRGEEIPTLIDEIPVLSVLASQANGETRIDGLSELRYKETNRMNAIQTELTRIGAKVVVENDSLLISGRSPLGGGLVKTFGDHRMAMAFRVASLASASPVTLDDTSCMAVSDPHFEKNFQREFS